MMMMMGMHMQACTSEYTRLTNMYGCTLHNNMSMSPAF